MSDTVELIKQDHRKVEKMFEQFKKTQDPELADEICIELTVHARLEEEMLYPLLHDEVNAREADHAQEEHDEAKQIILQIQEGDATGEALNQLVTKLEQVVSHHVQEEENEALPDMEKKLGNKLQQIFPAVVERKKLLFEEEEPDQEFLDLGADELNKRVEATTKNK